MADDQLVEDRGRVGRDGAGPADKGQADAAFCFFQLVAEGGVGGAAALGMAQGVAGAENPVLQPYRAKIKSTQKRVVTLSSHHAIPLWPPFQPITDCRTR